MRRVALIVLCACGRFDFDPNHDASSATHAVVKHGTAVLSASEVTSAVDVDLAHSLLVFGVAESEVDPATALVSGTLEPGLVRFRRNATGNPIKIAWHVIESSAIAVQSGTELPMLGDITRSVSLAPTDLATSFPIISWDGGGVSFSGNDLVRAELLADNKLVLSNDGGAGDLPDRIAWQVATIPTATVRSGGAALSMSNLTTSVTVAHATNSFLLVRYTAIDANAGVGGCALTAHFTATGIAFDRAIAGDPISITWYVVTIPGAHVATGAASFPNGSLSLDVPIASIDLSRSFAYVAANERGGSTSLDGVPPGDDIGVAWFTSELPSTNTLRLSRGAAQADANVTWFVVELP